MCHVWNSKSLSIILFPISNHIHHDDYDNLIIFCQIQIIWRTLKSKERRSWSLEFHIACHVWNSKSISIILFPISHHINHWGNDDLWIFYQKQDIWRTLKSKEGNYGALNFTSWVTFEIQNPYLSSYSPFLITFIMMIIIIW